MSWKTPTIAPLKRGLMKPEMDYVVPILRALAQNGGECRSIDVYALVAQQMTFNKYDLDDMRSKPEPRWQHNMRAARKWMVDKWMWEPKEVSGWGRWRLKKYGWYALKIWQQSGRLPED